MAIHRATFTQPGRELNPLGIPVAAEVVVEVYEVVKRIGGLPTGIWMAREIQTQRDFKQCRPASLYQARYSVARLFKRQLAPWQIDGQADPEAWRFHIHIDAAEPALCGSRFHQSLPGPPMGDASKAIILSELRSGRRPLDEAERLQMCSVCSNQIDRSPQPGDQIRRRIDSKRGQLLSLPDGHAKTKYYTVEFDGTQEMVTAGEIAILINELFPR